MFAIRTIIAIPAAVIALLGCGSGTDGNAPSNAAVIGLPGPASSTNWTLSGVPCSLIPVPAAAPLGTGTCPGVRPGAIVRSDVGQCTLNFLFLGSDGASYIGTAGHCILGASPFGGDVGEMSWAPGTGPVARGARPGQKSDRRVRLRHSSGPEGLLPDPARPPRAGERRHVSLRRA